MLRDELLARGESTQGLYVPRGEAGMVRMISALLDMGAGEGADEALRSRIAWFEREFRRRA